jgi:hypothetical protein
VILIIGEAYSCLALSLHIRCRILQQFYRYAVIQRERSPGACSAIIVDLPISEHDKGNAIVVLVAFTPRLRHSDPLPCAAR